MSNDKPHILVILASIREGRQGEKVARWFHRLASERDDLEAEWVDVRDWPLPPYQLAEQPYQAEKTYADPRARAWVELVGGADGYAIVTPEYNHGYPPSLKNMLDHVYAGWNDKPVGFVSYGGVAGGTRAVEQLRLVSVELQMTPIRAGVVIPFVSRAFDASGNPTNEVQAKQAAAMLDQLLWWAKVLAEGRARHPKPGSAPKPAVKPAPVGAPSRP
jgi:NAD(P)H-dependent FMN reductase